MAQKIEKVFCPSCGAPVKFLDGREDTFCTSCGMQLYRKDTHLEMKLKHEQEKMKHERAKMKHEEEMAEKVLREYRNDKGMREAYTALIIAVVSFILLFIILDFIL